MSNEPRRVFCKDCKHISWGLVSPFGSHLADRCATDPRKSYNPVLGEQWRFEVAAERNADMNCTLFEPAPPPEPTPEPKRSWWARWRRA